MVLKVPDAEYWALRVKPSGSTLLTKVVPLPANSKPPAVNWDVWLNMPRVVLWKAVALSLNIEPDEATATGRAFESRMSLAVAHLADGLLRHIEVNDVRRVAFTRVRLVDISLLADSCQWSVPDEFPKAEALPVVVQAHKAITPSLVTNALSILTHSTKTRRNTLTPVIELAQRQCLNPIDTAEVWAALQVLAHKKEAPLIGATEEGLQYFKGGEAAVFTRDALRKRLTIKRG